jgi:hypothetical protein
MFYRNLCEGGVIPPAGRRIGGSVYASMLRSITAAVDAASPP